MHKNKTPIHPTCPTCGTPASRVLEPTTYTHPNGRVQRMQEAYCHRCHESFRTLKRYGPLPATLPISLRESKPAPRCPDCDRRVRTEGRYCAACAWKGAR